MQCPDCGSEGAFRPQRRDFEDRIYHDGEPHRQIFVRCRQCRWESVTCEGPALVVELEMDIERLRGKVAAGQASLADVLRARESRRDQMIAFYSSG